MNSDIIDKLKKILARTEGNGATEAEMNTAMAMAQKLAMAHNIDLASIKTDAGEEESPSIETDIARVKSQKYVKQKAHHDPIAIILMECFQVKFIYTDSDRIGAAIVGERFDVQMATYCYHWLDGLFPQLYSKYCKKLGLGGDIDRVRRRSYFEGLSAGIRANNRRAVQDLNASDANKYALVLVSKKELVEARYHDEFPNARAAAVRARQFHDGAYGQGKHDGASIKLRGGLENSKVQLT